LNTATTRAGQSQKPQPNLPVEVRNNRSSSPAPHSETRLLAATCRTKLSLEAAQADHRLDRLVAHANTLDTLVLILRDEERMRIQLVNRIRSSSEPQKRKKVQWIDQIVEELGEDDSDGETADSTMGSSSAGNCGLDPDNSIDLALRRYPSSARA
jgi:hypothetical protein